MFIGGKKFFNDHKKRILSKNILVVDEAKASFEIIEGKLKSTSYNLYVLKSIDKVVNKLKEKEFDIIFVGYSLIEKSKAGLDVMSEYKNIQPHTPIVVLCGVPSVQLIVRLLRTGAYDVLLKPVDPEEFFELFQRSLLEKSKSIREYNEHKRLEYIAESANLMENIGFIFSGVRHELGNPVNAIKMTLSVLMDGIKSLSDAQVLELLHRMQSDIGRMEFLLNSLKNFSLFEKPQPESFAISEFFIKFEKIISDDLRKRNISFDINLDSEIESVNAYIDPRMLQQILLNLVLNAADAKDERKEESEISINCGVSDDMISIVVKDNGLGISKDDMKNLFQPFFTTKERGTGLGLVIVKKMLTNSNGTIEVKSIESVGTEMKVLIPTGRF
jgi:signal transduction histidine kinase